MCKTRKSRKKGELVVISGYSGVGKGTVIKRLMEQHPEYTFSVSATTRAPRPGETDGREYFFISRETFDKWLGEDRFLEHTQYLDKCYGTLRDYVEQKRNEGMSIILDIEVEGALNVKRACPDAKLIYIIPPSAEDLKNRIIGRGTETDELITKRLAKAVDETPVIPNYHFVVVNDDVQASADEIHGLVNGLCGPRRDRTEAIKLSEQIREDLLNILKNR